MDALPPIPTPPAQRWRAFRMHVVPVIIFVAVLAAIALMWNCFIQPSGVVREVEAVKANVIGTNPDVDRAVIAAVQAD